MFDIVYAKAALKKLRKMSKDDSLRIRSAIEELRTNPAEHPDVKTLVGVEGYRLRVGSWRVLFEIYNDSLIVRINRVKPRGDAYKG